MKEIRIITTDCNFEREPFLVPFGFKGGYLDELWQVAAMMQGPSGHRSVGLGAYSVLWSDAEVFAAHSQSAGNSLMFLMTDFALDLARGMTFTSPLGLFDQLLSKVHEYGKTITGRGDLRMTFALNSLVAVDNAAWLLYCAENGITGFDEMIPESFRHALPFRHGELAAILAIPYGMRDDEITDKLTEGYSILKIKLGSDPDKDGDAEKMLRWDMQRLAGVHALAAEHITPYTENGRIAYYLDANGRYGNKDMLLRFLDFADRIGSLDRIILFEEPFPEHLKLEVGDLPVRIAADESAHSELDALERIGLGYGAIALKSVAKTLSMSLKILKAAVDHKVPCFCADLTVNPIMAEWNKNVAARIAPLPGIKIGTVESNGNQFYKNWPKMMKYHPFFGSDWLEPKQGAYQLTGEFYAQSGGIFTESSHYSGLVK